MYWHTNCCKGRVPIFGCHSRRTLPNPSFIDYRAETQRLDSEVLGLVETWPKPSLTNYSSSRCVRPMTVSLASWALNFPSVWATGGQRGERDHIKTRTQSIVDVKAPETSHYHLTAAVWDRQVQSSLHCLWTVTGVQETRPAGVGVLHLRVQKIRAAAILH